MVESLRFAGCEVRVVAPVPWPRRIGRPAQVAPAESYPTYWYPPGAFRSHYHQAMWWSISGTLARISRVFRPQAVLGLWADPDGTVALRLARSLGIPGAVIVVGSDVMLLPTDPARRRVIARTLQAASHVFAVGSVLGQRAINLGADPRRVTNFIAGVDATLFAAGSRDHARMRLGVHLNGPMLLWVGSMVAVKAVEHLLRAVAQLTGEFPDVRVALVGDGPQRAGLQHEVAGTPSLSGRVTFVGAVDHKTLPDWYRAANLVVLPSRSEGVPNVLLEAMACGIPFVASDVGSIRDLLPFGPSTTVRANNPAALAEAIAGALRAGPEPVAPRVIDRHNGAQHLLRHLKLEAT